MLERLEDPTCDVPPTPEHTVPPRSAFKTNSASTNGAQASSLVVKHVLPRVDHTDSSR